MGCGPKDRGLLPLGRNESPLEVRFEELAMFRKSVKFASGTPMGFVVLDLFADALISTIPSSSRRQRPRQRVAGFIAAVARAIAVPATYMQVCWPHVLLNGMPAQARVKLVIKTSLGIGEACNRQSII